MQYDPIKRSLGKVFNKTPWLRVCFYKMLDLLLLRTYHVRRELNSYVTDHPSVDVLDAGMGFGQYSYFLASHYPAWKVTGVDVKQEQVDDCNNFFAQIGRKNASFHYADLENFDESNSYDLVLSIDVMEHIPDDQAVFNNLCKALRPGGMLLISTPSDQGGSDVHDHGDEYKNDGSASFIDEHVRDGYNVADIADKLRKAGFNSSEVKYSYGVPGKISWKLTMKYPILMLNATKLFFIVLPFYYLVAFPVGLILNLADARMNHPTGTGLIVKAWK